MIDCETLAKRCTVDFFDGIITAVVAIAIAFIALPLWCVRDIAEDTLDGIDEIMEYLA